MHIRNAQIIIELIYAQFIVGLMQFTWTAVHKQYRLPVFIAIDMIVDRMHVTYFCTEYKEGLGLKLKYNR